MRFQVPLCVKRPTRAAPKNRKKCKTNNIKKWPASTGNRSLHALHLATNMTRGHAGGGQPPHVKARRGERRTQPHVVPRFHWRWAARGDSSRSRLTDGRPRWLEAICSRRCEMRNATINAEWFWIVKALTCGKPSGAFYWRRFQHRE